VAGIERNSRPECSEMTGRNGAKYPLVSCVVQELGGIALNQVAKRYDRDQVTLSLGLKALRQKIAQDAGLRRNVENLLSELRRGEKTESHGGESKEKLNN
jgi:hypothetical protein